MTFSDSIRTCYENYVDFKGRASQSEYWWFYLFNFLVTIVYFILMIIFSGGLVLASITSGELESFYSGSIIIGVIDVIYKLYSIGTLIPSLAVTFRRLHDTGRSAWNLLFALIPIVGPVVLLVFLCGRSDEENEYGLPDY